MKKRLTALISSVALTALFTLGAGAFDLEKPESADELSANVPQSALSAEAITDPELGILISINDFENDTVSSTTINQGYGITNVLHLINDANYPAEIKSGLLTATPYQGYSRFSFQYRNDSNKGQWVPKSGTYTTTFDLRNDSTSNQDIGQFITRYLGYPDGPFNYKGDCYLDAATIKNVNANKGVWQSAKVSYKFTDNGNGTFTMQAGGRTDSVTSSNNAYIYLFDLYAQNAESVSIDNIRLWYFPADAYVLQDGESYSFAYYESGDFTFGSPESDTNFVGWVSSDGTLYAAGAVIAAADVSTKLLGKTFTAFYQDASLPAMGMAFEGTNDKSVNYNIGIVSGDSNVKDASYVIEDSRTAVRIYCENGDWNPRFHALAETPFDPNEYTIVQYVYKAAQGQNTAGTDISGTSARLLYWTSAETNGFYTDGEHKISGGDIGIAVDNEWKTLTYDMSDAANSIAAHPWNKTGAIYGISASPLRAPVLSISYIDAIRVYRKGVVTVTYDTNAPAGAKATKTVAADTNRGVGTGYYLSSDIPAVKDYDFAGWALKPDASAFETVSTIDLTGDTTVYAVWVDKNAPITSDKTSIRTSGVTGIRFKASVYNKILTSEDDTEIGFLVTRSIYSDYMESDYNGLTLDMASDGLALKGAAYAKTDGEVTVNHISDDGDGVYSSFTACMTGIPKGYYTENILVRPYVTLGNVTYYGQTKEESLYNAAKNYTGEENQTVKDIIAAGEEELQK